MFTQTLFPGFDGRRQRLNLFLALVPPSSASEQIDELAENLRDHRTLEGKPLGASRYHVPVHHLATCYELTEEFVPRVREIFGPAAAGTAPFEIEFDRALSFGTRAEVKPFVLKNSGYNQALVGLYQKLGSLLPWRTSPVFTPHVTLLYDQRMIGEQPVRRVSWLARELVLVCSYVGLGRQEHLARWKLGGCD
jgi:2'-5' RNA ligase